MTKIKAYSEQEHEVEIEEEFLECSDLSPHVIVIDHQAEKPVVRKFNDSYGCLNDLFNWPRFHDQ